MTTMMTMMVAAGDVMAVMVTTMMMTKIEENRPSTNLVLLGLNIFRTGRGGPERVVFSVSKNGTNAVCVCSSAGNVCDDAGIWWWWWAATL